MNSDFSNWPQSASELRNAVTCHPERFGVTVVVTSCNRHDLLKTTLESFEQFNSFSIDRVLIVEDGPLPGQLPFNWDRGTPCEWVSTGERVGQIAAIDYVYSRVKSPFIFHLEDDWEFFAANFIEKSMIILLQEPKCLQVWLRAHDDTNNHPIETDEKSSLGVNWREMKLSYVNEWGEWNGFAFNPGLRRLCDYRKSNGYGSLAAFDFEQPGSAESKIGIFYKKLGFFAAILNDNDGHGYVRHIGKGRHVMPPEYSQDKSSG